MRMTARTSLLLAAVPLLGCVPGTLPPDYEGELVDVVTYTVRVPPPPKTWPMRPPPWGVDADGDAGTVTFTGQNRIIAVAELTVPEAMLGAPEPEVVASCVDWEAGRFAPLAPPPSQTIRYGVDFGEPVRTETGGRTRWRFSYSVSARADLNHFLSDFLDDLANSLVSAFPAAPPDTVERGFLTVVLPEGWRERGALFVVRLVPLIADDTALAAMGAELRRDADYVIRTLTPKPAGGSLPDPAPLPAALVPAGRTGAEGFGSTGADGGAR